MLLLLGTQVLWDCSDDALQDRVVPVPNHPQVVGTVIEDVCKGLLLPPTMTAQGAGDLLVAPCLHGAHRQQVQPSLVYVPVLIK